LVGEKRKVPGPRKVLSERVVGLRVSNQSVFIFGGWYRGEGREYAPTPPLCIRIDSFITMSSFMSLPKFSAVYRLVLGSRPPQELLCLMRIPDHSVLLH
jgi:hypothetical protein